MKRYLTHDELERLTNIGNYTTNNYCSFFVDIENNISKILEPIKNKTHSAEDDGNHEQLGQDFLQTPYECFQFANFKIRLYKSYFNS